MGLVDKFKKILFDEEEIEVPVGNDELPERSKKGKNAKFERKGFIDYHHDDDNEEDTIKEVVVPKDEPAKNNFNFPVDIDFESELRSRSRYRDEPTGEIKLVRKETPDVKREEVKTEPIFEESPVERDFYDMPKPREKSVSSSLNQPPKEKFPTKDYRKIIEEKPNKEERKPFKATPIISPVYGILDKNYTAEDLANKKPIKRDTPSSAEKSRAYGPVSFNDQPLPMKKTKEVVVVSRTVEEEKTAEKEKSPLKKDLHELNSTINELITDTIQAEEEKEKPALQERTQKYQEPKVEEPDAGIEETYVAHNDIEDAFDSTSEFDEEIPIKEKNSTKQDLDNTDVEDLSNTIETDLFNLIDSMYRNNDDNDNENEEDV